MPCHTTLRPGGVGGGQSILTPRRWVPSRSLIAMAVFVELRVGVGQWILTRKKPGPVATLATSVYRTFIGLWKNPDVRL